MSHRISRPYMRFCGKVRQERTVFPLSRSRERRTRSREASSAVRGKATKIVLALTPVV
jgi:hypothetical protein